MVFIPTDLSSSGSCVSSLLPRDVWDANWHVRSVVGEEMATVHELGEKILFSVITEMLI